MKGWQNGFGVIIAHEWPGQNHLGFLHLFEGKSAKFIVHFLSAFQIYLNVVYIFF